MFLSKVMIHDYYFLRLQREHEASQTNQRTLCKNGMFNGEMV